MLEVPLRRVQEVTHDEVVLGFAIGDLPDGITVEAEENCARVAQEDGGVRRDEKLRVAWPLEFVDDPEERKLTLWRERRLGLVEDVDTLFEPIGEKRQEGLTVGLLL